MQNDFLRYEYLNDGIEITGYVGYPEVLFIPSVIDDKRVLGIAEKAFSRCLTLKEVEIAEGVKYISSYAFYDCPALEKIELPLSIRKIGRKAFENTYYFHHHERVNGKLYVSAHVIDYVGDSIKLAINGCVGVADEAFKGAESLENAVFFDGLKYVGDRAFQNSGLKEVVLPNGLESIGDRAFANSPKIENASLPYGLKKIGYNPFFNTPIAAGEALYIDGYLIYAISKGKFKLKKGTKLIADGAMSESDMETAVLDGVESIPEGCFFNCRKLRKVSASSVTKVLDDAFANCAALKEIDLARDCVFGNDCFYGCSSSLPTTSSIADKNELYLAKRLISTSEIYGEYRVREGTLEVFPRAFSSNTKLVKTFIPDSVERVGFAAFSGCRNLSALKLPEGLTEIERDLCKNAEKLKEVELPLKINKIGKSSFEGTKIKEFSLNGAEEVEDSAFLNCSDLSVAYGLENVKRIGEHSFERTGLIEVNTSCSNIGKYAFAFSRSLRKVNVGAKNFPENAFYACAALKVLSAPKGDITIAKNTFAYCGSLTDIDLENATLSESSFEKCVKLSSVTLSKSIPAKAFKGCSAMKTVTLKEGVKSIGKEAFDGCSSIVELELPSSLENVGERAFDGNKIKELTLPEGVNLSKGAFENCKNLVEIKTKNGKNKSGELDDSVFENCVSLEKVELRSVSAIGKRAFALCANLKEISLPEGLTSVGTEAFSGDDSLKELTLPVSVKKVGKGFITDATVVKDDFLDLLKGERGALLKFSACTVKYKGDNILSLPRFAESCFDDENWFLKDIAAYDAFFGAYLEDKPLKEPYVKSRLLFPVGLTEKNKAVFLKEYFPALIERAINERNVKEVSAYARNGCFNRDNINFAVETASRIKAVDITSLLLAELKKLK